MKKRSIAAVMVLALLCTGCGAKRSTTPTDSTVSIANFTESAVEQADSSSNEQESDSRQVSDADGTLADGVAEHILDEDWQYLYDHLAQVENSFIEPADFQYYFMSNITQDNALAGKTSMRDQGYRLIQMYYAGDAELFGGRQYNGKVVVLDIGDGDRDFYIGVLPDDTAEDGFVIWPRSGDFWTYDASKANTNGAHGDFLIVPNIVSDLSIRGKAFSEDWRDDSVFEDASEAASLHNDVYGENGEAHVSAAKYKAYRIVLPVHSLSLNRETVETALNEYGIDMGSPSSLAVTGNTAYGTCTSAAPTFDYLNDIDSALDALVSVSGYTTDFVLDDNAAINGAMEPKLCANLTQIMNGYHADGTSNPDEFKPYFVDSITENEEKWGNVVKMISLLGDKDQLININPETKARGIKCTGARLNGDVHVKGGYFSGTLKTSAEMDAYQYGQFYTEQGLDPYTNNNTVNEFGISFNDSGDPLIFSVSEWLFKYIL